MSRDHLKGPTHTQCKHCGRTFAFKQYGEGRSRHYNGSRADNRIENLELWTGRHCKGQRVQDQIAWAIGLLREYPEYLSRSGYKLVSDIPNLHAPLPKCNISEAIQGLSGLCN